MGRPLSKKFFGNTNTPAIGGEGVASVTVGGTNNNYSSFPTVVFSAPQLPGGTTATGTVIAGVVSATITAAGTGYSVNDVLTLVGGTGTAATLTVNTVDVGGEILTFTVTTAGNYSALASLTNLAVTGGSGNDDATFTVTALKVNSIVMGVNGSGYTSAPTVTDTPDGNATLTPVLSSVAQNALSFVAFVSGGSSAVAGDIIKQASSTSYRVTTAQGTGRCKLVATAPAAGEMRLTATDSAGGTYYVTKLTARRATLVANTGTQFATNSSAAWTLGSPVAGVSVTIANA